MMKRKWKVVQGNPVIKWLLITFLIMTSIIGMVACYYAYQQKKAEILSELDKQLLRVAEEYKNITEDFWEIYLPIFEVDGSSGLFVEYFEESTKQLNSTDSFEMKKLLSNMAARDETVEWIVLYSPIRAYNYIYFPAKESMSVLPEDFSYLDMLTAKTKRMVICPRTSLSIEKTMYDNIAIVGGVPGKTAGGSIIVGYELSKLKQLCEIESGFDSLSFNIVYDEQVIFSSGNWTEWDLNGLKLGQNDVFKMDGDKWYVQVQEESLRGEYVFYAVKWAQIFGQACRGTIVILGLTLLMALLSVLMYWLALRSITGEVNIIREGLEVLGQNYLDYRIEGTFAQPELKTIAKDINRMSQSLKENIERAHEYEKRQVESEIQELQAKFNPHFLYNTLEMFQLRCYQNGDEETAELIAQTASIFRGFIGSKTFISIQEELAFSRKYLLLFQARYGESVKVIYDIDTEVLQYGIIRNVFQPLIENYFEHGYNAANKKNFFVIRGSIRDEETILFTIEDNGFGMEEENLQALNRKLREPITSEQESYGLRNLHQRLCLFYGGECGIYLHSKEEPGLVIEMIIMRKK
ncbi:MAG: hypothetical protein E7292_09845 [Lachnospiraceae bacterium]|nr:hypothetical protein [Lachnospiraceae bacterium]